MSAPKNIAKEWRFFVADGKVITGSLYKKGIEPCVEGDAIEFAGKVAGLYSPDRVWSLDVCMTESGNYYVLEIGCMSCSGIYACDTDKLVEVATHEAIKEFQEYRLNDGE